ncbi:16S rRNA (guanine(527)-N(7))-methyltransferase RsmG [Peptoniphilus sp. GNH]|nr:16S rRNA methyltransferase GidB [Clostridiales bacterium KA00134]UHR02324.1 16S rRNA (guanine(527)-N(7))-methyltransferase RsmG [Peptoniphilus sp. GNH]
MEFKEGLRSLGLCEDIDFLSFEKYKDYLLEKNKEFNITRITEESEIYSKHFLDSLSLMTLGIFDGKKSLIDIGTGGGFPGLPLKIYKKDLDVVLMDSLKKRINFLEEVCNLLKLENIKCIHHRAEEMAREDIYREKFDIATSRAVASLPTLLEYAMGFVKVGGYFVAMKGPNFHEELQDSKRAIEELGGVLQDVKEIEIEDFYRSLILVKKVKPTPKKYPRAGGKPKKAPIK